MTNHSRFLCALLLLIALLLLAACAAAPVSTPVPPSAVPTTAALTAAPTVATSQVIVTDGAKRTVTIAGVPQRVVSLAPSTTEIAYALGLGPRMIAVDKFSDYPPEVKTITQVSNSPLNLEQVVALKPDLVLAASITSPDDVKKLADLKMTVLVVGSMQTTLDGVMQDIILVGKATGTADKAKSVTDAMKQKISAVQAKVAGAKSKPKVYWELDATDPAKPYTPGPGSFIDQIITLAGGTNAAANAKSAYAQINAEEVIAANPDVIILSDYAYGTTVESVVARKGWSATNAVKKAQVFPIDDNLVSRPGPRLANGLEAAAKLIHPELFK